jgi:hypothetical protein
MSKKHQIEAVIVGAVFCFFTIRNQMWGRGAYDYDAAESMDRPNLTIGLTVGALAVAAIAYIIFFERG